MTYFCLQVNSSGQYLNIFNGSMANGAEACQGTNNTTPNFLWEIIPGTGDYFLLKVASSGQYLNILNGSTANGAEACQGTNNTTDNFLWQFVLPGSPLPHDRRARPRHSLLFEGQEQWPVPEHSQRVDGQWRCGLPGHQQQHPQLPVAARHGASPAFGSGGPAAGEWGERSLQQPLSVLQRSRSRHSDGCPGIRVLALSE